MLLVLGLTGTGAGRATAQTRYSGAAAPDVSAQESDSDLERPERKTPSFWRRASGDSPAEQLEIARQRMERGQLRRAARAFDALVRTWHDAPEAAEAQRELARVLELRGKLSKAFDAYQYLIVYYPGRFPHREIVEKQRDLALEQAARAKGFWRSGAAEEAIRMLRTLVRNAPRSPIGAEALLKIGRLYESLDRLDEAILAYDRFAAQYADHPEAPSAAFSAAKCRYEISRNLPRDTELCQDALSYVTSVLSRYPHHESIRELEEIETALRDRLAAMYYAQAEFYDSHHGSPRAARIAYEDFLRQFPHSEKSKKARQRLAELRAMADRPAPDEPGEQNLDAAEITDPRTDWRRENEED